MNREIKFRVWDDRLLKLNTFDLLTIDGNLPYDCITNIQQFTGLKDKNGKEIYEGDILVYTLSNSVFTGAVEWQNYGWVIQDFEYDIADTICGAYNPLVIGNIYENPELIKTEI